MNLAPLETLYNCLFSYLLFTYICNC